MSILVILGTKAQFIKTAPILCEMEKRGMPYQLVYTGQHSETFDLLEAAFGVRKADDVLVPQFEASTKVSFASWTWRFWLEAFKRIARGDWKGSQVGLVHGDTASTLFGAIAIRLAGIKVGHVEAGLRSPKLLTPFPEELIRRLVSRMSNYHYAPDAVSAENLSKEGGSRVVMTQGNTLKDALLMALGRMTDIPRMGGDGGYAVVSVHRNENISSRADFVLLMESVVDAARILPIKFVLHPVTRSRMVQSGWTERLNAVSGLTLLDRMDYPDFVRLLLGSRFLMTDGGSNQEEAAMLGLPTLLLRRATERSDGLGDGVVLSGLERSAIEQFVRLHANRRWRVRAVSGRSPSSAIVDSLSDLLRETVRPQTFLS